MRRAHVTIARPQHSQRSFEEHQQLVELVKAMTQEIERLHDDNAQLRAAVEFYREAVRTCNQRALSA